MILTLKPKLEQIMKYGIGLVFHFLGSLGNLILLWLFTTNGWSGSNRQFACVGTVVPALLDGVMFAVLTSIYCIFSSLTQLVQVKSFSKETQVLHSALSNSIVNI